jgi:leucyl-tRNA synthetase
MRFNTAISAMMVFVNDAITWETKPVSVLREFLILLAAVRAAHCGRALGKTVKLKFELNIDNLNQPGLRVWPKFDPALLVESEIEIPVQVNGKLRDVIKVPSRQRRRNWRRGAKNEKAKPYHAGKTIKKVIVVPKKLVNIVAV